jgi:uncharacterized membrane protein YkvA (DUF1232 family)
MFEKLKEKAKELKYYILALCLAYKRKDLPIIAKAIIIITIGYALSPIDLIPDFIPVLGYLDDLIILPLLVSIAIKLIPKNILEECKGEAKEMWRNGKPKRWYYGIPIIIIWVMVAIVIIKKAIEIIIK